MGGQDTAGECTLYVYVHGFRRSPSDLHRLRDHVQDRRPEAHHFCPRLPLGLLSTHRAAEISAWLSSEIDARCRDQARSGSPYTDIVLIGHSAGAQLLRAAWLLASGCRPDRTINQEAVAEWATKVSRIVLLACVARGWSPNVAMSPGYRLQLWLAGWLESLPVDFFIFDMRRGSAFITTLRLQWMALERSLGARMPVVVQLLGTTDDLLSPTDNVDLLSGKSFYYFEVPGTDHFEVIQPTSALRTEILSQAILESPANFVGAISIEEMADLFAEAADDFDAITSPNTPQGRLLGQDPGDAVMIVHGIRDYGFWTKKLGARIKAEARSLNPDRPCRTVTSTYGYFPMGPFLWPPARKRRVEWFMDQYVQACALYGEARFAFVGHSNGTYLLADALDRCEAVRFDSVVLAGSVVSPGFDWERLKARGQVKNVLNYVATGDWVVALFPKFFGRIPWFGLGSAGHDGFRSGAIQIRYAPGGHDAALKTQHWSDIARFVLNGTIPPKIPVEGRRESTRREGWLYVFSWTVVPILVGVAGLIGFFCYRLATHSELSREALALIVAIGFTVWLVRLVLRKF